MKRKLLSLVLLLALCVPWAQLWADATPALTSYGFSTGVDATKWIDISSGSTTILASSSGDSKASSVTAIGFTFNFAGTDYTQFSVNTDGNLRLGSTATGTGSYSTPFSSSNANSNAPKINAFGADGKVSSAGYVKYKLTGTTPNQVLVVEFATSHYYGTANDDFCWQIQLSETSNQVQIVYSSTAPQSSSKPSSYTFQIGMSSSSTDVVTVDPTSNTVSAGATSTAYAFSNWPSPNRYYTFSVPTCYAPTNFTHSATATTATINWNAGKNETQWQYVYCTSVSTPDWTNPTDVTSATCSLTSLNANTSYDIYVRSNCSATDLSTAVKYTFKTECAAVVPGTLGTVGFETSEGFVTGSGNMANCWTVGNKNTTSSSCIPYVYSSYAKTGSNCLYLNAYKYWNSSYWSNNSDGAYAIMPEMTFTNSITDYQVEFYMRKSSTSSYYDYIDTLWVGIVSDPSDLSNLEIVGYGVNTTTTYSKQKVTFSSYSGGNSGYIVFLAEVTKKKLSGYKYCYASFYVDDVTVSKQPSCVEPSGLTVNSKTATTATLSWTAGGSENTWNVDYSTDQTTWETVQATTNTNFVLNPTSPALTPNTPYYVRVQAVCTSGSSPYTDPVSFKTPCNAVPVTSASPFNEDFNDLTSGIPDCWDNSEGTTTTESYKWNYYSSGNTGACVRFNSYSNSSGLTNMLKTPILSLPANPATLSFYYKNPAGGDFSVYISTDGGSTYTTPLQTGLTSQSNWTNVDISLSSYVSQDVVIVFKATSNCGYGDAYIYLDDVKVEAPDCAKPTDLAATNITASSVDLSWTAGGEETAWNMQYSTDNSTWTPVSGTITNPYTLTGLTANTPYYVQVQADCSGSTSDWTSSVSFTTSCVAETNFPYSEGFEGSSFPPSCWSQRVVATSTSGSYSNSWTSSSSYKHDGSKSAYIPDKQVGAQTALTSCPFNFTSAKGYQVSFWMYRGSSNQTKTDEALHVYVASSATADLSTAATELGVVNQNYQNDPAESAYGWYQYTYLIPKALTGQQYIIFCYHNQYGSGTYIDDVKVEEQPDCAKPTGVTVSDIATDQADINITGGSAWTIKYIDTGNTDTNDTVTVNNVTSPYTLTGLSSNTSYQVKVQTNCGTDGNSEWTSEVQFRTTCAAISTLPYNCGFESTEINSESYPMPWCWTRKNDATNYGKSYPCAYSSYPRTGSNSLYFNSYYSSGYADNQIAVLPEISSSLTMSNLRLVFYARTYSSYGGNVYVGVMSDPTDISTWTPVETLSVTNTAYQKFDVRNFPTNSGAYMAIRVMKGSSYTYIYIDDVQISTIPTCADLTGDGVTVSEIKNTSVKLTVTDNTADGSWSYAYDDQGLDVASLPSHDVTTPGTVTLSGLSPATDYVIYARRKCNSEYGEWSEGVYFRTACNPTTVPFSDDFESTSTGELGGCYNVSDGGAYYKLYVMSGSTYSANSGSKGICSSYSGSYSSSTSSTYTVTRLVTLESGTNYKISVYAKAYSSSYYWNLGFVYGSDNATLTPFESKSVNSTSFAEYSSTFNVSADGDYYVGIRTSNSSSYYPYFDDFSITEVACVQPTGVTATNTTSDAATITWTGGVGSTSYDLKYKLSSASDDEANWTEYTGVTSPYNLTGLSANTSYDVKVKAYCSSTPTDYTDAITFRTDCEVLNITKAQPYTYGFEDATTGSSGNIPCWSKKNDADDSYYQSYPYAYNYNARTGNNCAYFYQSNSSSYPENQILIFPLMSNDANTLRVKFWAKKSSSSYTATLQVGVMSNPADASTFTQVGSDVTLTTTYTEYEVQLNTYTGSGKYVAINCPRYTSYTYNSIYVDDVELSLIPTCVKPTGLAVEGTTLTSTTADLTWTAGGTEDTWNLQYKLSSDDSWTSVNGLTSASYQLTNLTAATSYDVHVQADCGGGDESEWSSTLTFTTACPASVSVPYTEDFEGMTVSTVPTCWDNSGSTTSTLLSNPDRVWGVYEYSSNKMIRMYNYYVSYDGDALINTPAIALPANNPCQLAFKYAHNASSGDFKVKISTDNGVSFTDLATYSKGSGSSYSYPGTFTNAVIDLSSYKGQTVILQFWNQPDYNSGAIFVDDISVTENVNTFTGDEDNDWTVSDNWSKGTVPTAGQAVIINANCSIPDAADAVCDAMTINYPLYVAPTASLVAASIDNTNAANLVIGSDEDGTGTVKFTSGTAPKATVEMYFKGHATWYPSENKYMDPQWEYRGFIGTPDAAQTLSYIKVFKWNETLNGDNCWEDFAENSSADYTAKTGYSMANYNCSTAVTRTYTTTLTAVGDITYTGLTKTETGTGSSTSYNCGVNLITNSMSAPINMSDNGITATGITEYTFYLFNTRSYNDWKADQTAAITTFPFYSGSAIADHFIPAGQSFVVKANTTGASLTIPASAISSNESGPMYAPAENSEFGILAITAESEDGVDELYLLESNLCDEKFNNGYDGTKMFASNAPQIYASNDYGMTAVNADKTLLGQYIGVRQGSTSNSITLTISRRGLENYSDLKLYDCLSETYYDLDNDETTITVTATGDQPRRFLISGKRDDGTEYTPTESGKFVIAGDQLMLENFGRTDAQIMLTDASGKILWSESSRNGTTFTLPQLPAGVYFISCGKVSTKYITK